jgi:predicted DNA-binding WGR domain protein
MSARRFEFTEGSSSKFWAVERSARTVTVTFGRIGSSGQEKAKSFPTEEKATHEEEKLIAEKLGKGYREVTGGAKAKPPAKAPAPAKAKAKAPPVENDAPPARAVGTRAAAPYEKRIEAAPDDAEGWRRYARWLEGEGDPCGELIEIELALAGASGAARGKHEAARKALLAKHAGAWFGPALTLARQHKLADLRNRYGFVDNARLCFGERGTELDTYVAPEDEGKVPGPQLPPVPVWLRELRASPLARFVRGLTFGETRIYGATADFGALVEELSAAGGMPTLESLWLGDFDDGENYAHAEPGDIAPLFGVSPRLRRLALDGARPLLRAPVEHAALEHLALHTIDLPKGTAAALARSRFPRLDGLELSFRSDAQIGGSVDWKVDTLAPLFEGKGVPKLRHLGLTMSAFGDDLVRALLGSKLLAQLETLDLGYNRIEDAGADQLAAAAGKLSHLERIGLKHNTIQDATEKKLRKALGKRVTPREALFGDPDEHPHWREHGKWCEWD